ncbi:MULTISPECIES: xanthine dehydrogenase family protein subunit M [unclassified Sinorhizobium]|uniref:FAD binding domain-containing protein n=1 Tax=unclassified Sinorhizobium TaxID=2613772 RepID=UPI003524203B
MRPFDYFRATTPADAIAALASGGEGTRLLAGGTTLYDLMKLDIEQPQRIVDINGLDLRQIEVSSDELIFGALSRMSDVAEDPHVTSNYPALSESLWKAASQQLRNMASLGGNLLQRTRCAYFRHGAPYACNKREPGSGCAALEGLNRGHALFGGSESCIATYAGDFAVALLAFDANIDVIGPRGARSIPLADFHVSPGADPARETSLEHDELIMQIRVPATPAGRNSTYHKIRDRESYAFATVSVAAAILMEGGSVSEARLALGGVATKPLRATAAEAFLLGKPLTLETARAAGELAFEGAHVTHHNAFKIELGARAVADALMIAKGRA